MSIVYGRNRRASKSKHACDREVWCVKCDQKYVAHFHAHGHKETPCPHGCLADYSLNERSLVESFCKDNILLVRSVVNRAVRWNCSEHHARVYGERDDFFSEGLVALLRAARRYDTTRKEAKFSTYAVWCIIDHIRRVMDRAKRSGQFGPLSENGEIGLAISWESFMFSDGNQYEPMDLADDLEINEHAIVYKGVDFVFTNAEIRKRVLELPKRYRDIIYRRYWRQESLPDIGRRYGITKQRVRQLVTKAVRYLEISLDSKALLG